jgi:hypothetical protein
MHKAQDFISACLLPVNASVLATTTHALNMSEATSLSHCLMNDAVSYLYSSTISVGDAVRGINCLLLTWATVKLYYATFYALRSLLALDGIGIFYVGSRPFAVEARAGSLPVKRNGPTHKVVIDEFRARNTDPYLLSQPIGFDDPLNWLMLKREEANYKNAKFSEPTIPDHFRVIVQSGIRLSIKEYLQDIAGTYLFDPDHAILAYPLSTLKRVYDRCRLQGIETNTGEEIGYITKLFSDSKGPVPEVHNLLKTGR